MWARLYAPDAALIEARVEEMARAVCDADPRSIGERRAAALTALADGAALACACGQPDCPRAPTTDRPAKNAVVYVVADQTSVDAAKRDVAQSADTDTADAPSSQPDAPSACASAPPAYVFGGGILPTALLGSILERARVREVRHPGEASSTEPRYTPSPQICEFVRCRDLTCRFPGCDKAAQFCDLDHTVPYPVGPTHPSNLKCLCRFHHLVKTFWGWRDNQLPDQSWKTHP
jgi:hypothetical protein